MKDIGKILHIIAFCLIFIIVFNKVSGIIMSKSSEEKYNEFFSTESNYDVLFLGSSTVRWGILPMELYEEYGIASYNLGNYSSRMPATYYTLLNALNYTTPEVVVVDLFRIESTELVTTDTNMSHIQFDTMPFSLEKIETINKLFHTFDEKVEMTIPFVKYHSRWKSLTQEDFTGVNIDGDRGAIWSLNIAENLDKPQLSENIYIDESYSIGKDYLEKIIKLCEEKDIQVVLTLLPGVLTQEETNHYNYGYLLAEKYDIDYIDYNSLNNLVDYDTDFFDSYHMNLSGAVKVTNHIGEYLLENYDLEDHREDEEYHAWDSDYEKYVQVYINNFNSNRKNINSYLLLCNNDNFECTISMSKAITEEEYTLIHKLINNIPDVNIVNKQGDADISITVYRKTTGEQISSAKFRINKDTVIEAYE